MKTIHPEQIKFLQLLKDDPGLQKTPILEIAEFDVELNRELLNLGLIALDFDLNLELTEKGLEVLNKLTGNCHDK